MSLVSYQIFSDWESVAAIWSQLLPESQTNTFFQEITIQQAWWESVGKPSLQLVVVNDDNAPIALFPFTLRDNTLQFLGDQDVSDYLDALILPEHSDAAYEGLTQYLSEHSAWQKLQLISVPEDSSTFHGIKTVADTLGLAYQQTQQDVCPIIDLPATWDEYLAAVGKKQRHEIKRKWLRLEEQGKVTFRVVKDTNADPEALETFFTLHRQSSVEKEKFWTPEHTTFFKHLSDAASKGGWLRLYFLDFDGTPAASMYCFEYGDDLLIYNSGFNATAFVDKSIGQVMMAFTIKDAIEHGKKRYDFLRGGEEYKLRYRPVVHPVFNVVVEKFPNP